MALTNVIPLGTTSHSTTLSGGAGGTPTTYGADSYIVDSDFNTYRGISVFYGADGGSYCSVDSYHTWTTPRVIQSVRSKMFNQNRAYGNYANRGVNPMGQQIVQLRINGTWTTVWSYTTPYTGGDGQPDQTDLLDQTTTGPWSNVTGMRGYVYASSYSYEGGRSCQYWTYIYELQAFANLYGDIGLRVKTPTTIQAIGVDQLLSTHSLRISKGGITYGIPLLSTSDIDASTVRIEKGGVTYALPKAS